MAYISSEKMREENISYESIDKNVKERTTWAVGTGILADVIKKKQFKRFRARLGVWKWQNPAFASRKFFGTSRG